MKQRLDNLVWSDFSMLRNSCLIGLFKATSIAIFTVFPRRSTSTLPVLSGSSASMLACRPRLFPSALTCSWNALCLGPP
jgi:hypothetical protein